MLKKILQSLVITSIVCLSSCVSTIISPSKNETIIKIEQKDKPVVKLEKEEKFEYLPEKPNYLFIDESNNGIIVYEKSVFKIKDLNITKEEVQLEKNEPSKPYITNASYYVDNNGDGLFVFTRKLGYAISPPYAIYRVMKISKNNFMIDTMKTVFKGADSVLHIKIVDKNNFYLFYHQAIDSLDPLGFISLDVGPIILDTTFKFNLTKVDDINIYNFANSGLKNIFLEMNEKGNGWIYDDMNESTKYFLKDYNKIEVKDENFIEKDYYRSIKADLDINGNGNILFVKEIKRTDTLINNVLSKELYIQKFSNLKKVSTKKLIIKSNEIPSIKENIYDEFPLKDFLSINKDGNGIIFFNKKSSNKDGFEYLYMKRVNNFKVEEKEIKLTESSKYVCHKFAINEQGNGLVILELKNTTHLTDKPINSFILKKFRHYEIEK